ncbi:MAG: (d)CMP kinase [Gammaproteobacteria bacterium]|nr:(d)CMP kinase [Gammaproteobacteria bacterium]
MKKAPVITIDGLCGSGKGTIALLLAQALHWHYLDSGMLYRVLALAVGRNNARENLNKIKRITKELDVEFTFAEPGQRAHIILQGEDVSEQLYHQQVGLIASQISSLPEVRAALLARQQAFRQEPGLVTDGRDMGTVVFPDAELKLFFTADLKERVQRRYKQLQAKGIDAKVSLLETELAERDRRDMTRSLAPLTVAEGALTVDTSHLTIDEVLSQIKDLVKQHLAVKM